MFGNTTCSDLTQTRGYGVKKREEKCKKPGIFRHPFPALLFYFIPFLSFVVIFFFYITVTSKCPLLFIVSKKFTVFLDCVTCTNFFAETLREKWLNTKQFENDSVEFPSLRRNAFLQSVINQNLSHCHL